MYGIRYYIPILCFLAILGGSRIAAHPGACRRIVIAMLCVVQVPIVLGYVYSKRYMDIATQETIDYLQSHADPGDRVLSPIMDVPYAAKCTTIWDRPISLHLLDYLFNARKPHQIERVLRMVSIRYILVPKKRVYDWETLNSARGYPISFLDGLGKTDSARKVFENRRMTIWEISDDPSKIRTKLKTRAPTVSLVSESLRYPHKED